MVDDFIKWMESMCSDENGVVTVHSRQETYFLRHDVGLSPSLECLIIDMVKCVKQDAWRTSINKTETIDKGKDCPWT